MEKRIVLTLSGVKIERNPNGITAISTEENQWEFVTLTEEQYKALRKLIDIIEIAEACMSKNDGQHD